MLDENRRNYAIDNLRAMLIFCVVAGHLLEIFSFTFSRELYVLLYSFHMPAFVFVSGMCCKLDQKTPVRLLHGYLYPYLVFQTLYLIFANVILKVPSTYQYTTPYWLLWYLLAMLIWQMMLLIYSGIRSKKLAFCGSVLVALLAGFDHSIGYYASLSRALVLFPFFLGGYYVSNRGEWTARYAITKNSRVLAAGIGIVLAAFIMICAPNISNEMVYHSYAYSAPDFHVVHRLIMLGIAWIWIGVLYVLVPRVKIPWLTYCGQNTMPIFLLHGFIMRIIGRVVPHLQLRSHCIAFVVLTLLIPLLLSSPPIVAISKPLIRFPFVKKRIQG